MSAIATITGGDVERLMRHAATPVVLDFYQASCPPCRVLEPRLERVAQQYAGAISVYRVDVDNDLAVAERFGVMSLPTVLVVKGGQEVKRLDGLITEGQLTAAFEQASGS